MKFFPFFLVITLLFSGDLLFSNTSASKSGQIIIDGSTSDFNMETDQILLSPELSGFFYEQDNDSAWGSGNDVSRIKVTWDSLNLYLSVEAACANNSVILYIDTGRGVGASSVSTLPAWKRKLSFVGMAPDFFLAGMDNNTQPQFWYIQGTSSDVEKTGEIEAKASFYGTVRGGMEARIPWKVLYGLGDYGVKTNTELKLSCLITGGDNTSSPDAAPDTTESLSADVSETVEIDNYLKIKLDSNGDGIPDLGVSVKDATTVAVNTTALKYQELGIIGLEAVPKAFSPDNDGIHDQTEFSFSLSKNAKVECTVFSLDGKEVKKIQEEIPLTSGEQSFFWDGRDDAGKWQPAGPYLVRVAARESGVKVVRKIPVYLVR